MGEGFYEQYTRILIPSIFCSNWGVEEGGGSGQTCLLYFDQTAVYARDRHFSLLLFFGWDIPAGFWGRSFFLFALNVIIGSQHWVIGMTTLRYLPYLLMELNSNLGNIMVAPPVLQRPLRNKLPRLPNVT